MIYYRRTVPTYRICTYPMAYHTKQLLVLTHATTLGDSRLCRRPTHTSPKRLQSPGSSSHRHIRMTEDKSNLHYDSNQIATTTPPHPPPPNLPSTTIMQDYNESVVENLEVSFVVEDVEDAVAQINNPNRVSSHEDSSRSSNDDTTTFGGVPVFPVKTNPRKNLSTMFEQVNEAGIKSKAVRKDGKQVDEAPCREENKAVLPPLRQRVAVPSSRKNHLPVYLRIRPLKDSISVSTMEVLPTDPPHHVPTAVLTRPPSTSAGPRSSSSSLHRPNTTEVKRFNFTQVLTPTSSQQSVYEATALPLIQNLLDEKQSTSSVTNAVDMHRPVTGLLFSYGITNAGKTHTMWGDLKRSEANDDDNSGNWGIIPRTIAQFLQRATTENQEVYLSFFEIYQENVYDLLSKTSRRQKNTDLPPDPLKVRESQGETIVQGLEKHRIHDIGQGLDLTLTAQKRRHTSSNNLNSESSRSHCVCQIQLLPRQVTAPDSGSTSLTSEYTANNDYSSTRRGSTFWIVDLAGSERSKRTQTSIARQKEAAQINRSLMTLMRCLRAMRENKGASIIPFRESKITHIFMGHLTGPSAMKTAMIVNVHPSIHDFEETQHVLGYAVSANLIPMSAIEGRRAPVPEREEYDMNGHRRKPLVKSASSSSLPTSKNRPPPPKATSSSGSLLARMVKGLKKLSPVKCQKRNEKRKVLLPPSHDGTDKVEPISKRCRVTEMANMGDPRSQAIQPVQTAQFWEKAEFIEVQEALKAAQEEIKRLVSEKSDLLEDLALQEQQIRGEVSEEMEQRLTAARERSQQEVERMRLHYQRQQEHLQNQTRQAQQQHLDRQLEALMDKVDECEEEMKRMQIDHETQLAECRDELDVAQKEATARIAELESALAASQEQVQRLKRSKMELVENYEKLLSHEAEEDETTDDHSHVPEEEDDEEEEEGEETGTGQGENTDDHSNVQEEKDDEEGEDDEETGMGQGENDLPVWKQKLTRKKQPTKAREILGTISTNRILRESSLSTSKNCDDVVFPKRQSLVKNDGLFRRPMGRAPKGYQWDASLGAWRSTV